MKMRIFYLLLFLGVMSLPSCEIEDDEKTEQELLTERGWELKSVTVVMDGKELSPSGYDDGLNKYIGETFTFNDDGNRYTIDDGLGNTEDGYFEFEEKALTISLDRNEKWTILITESKMIWLRLESFYSEKTGLIEGRTTAVFEF